MQSELSTNLCLASCYESEIRNKARIEEEEEARVLEQAKQEGAGKVYTQAESVSRDISPIIYMSNFISSLLSSSMVRVGLL